MNPTVAAALMERHRVVPSRALGQNFLVDPNTARRVAALAEVGPGDRVLEIGAGLGSLTVALAATGAEVTAVETDPKLVAVLGETLAGRDVRLVHADATKLDWQDLLVPPEGWVMASNLPYNIATPLVLDLLEKVPAITRMLVMVQKEVAERLAASPGDQAFGAVSLKVSYYAQARVLGVVGPSVFYPRPRVRSALVGLLRRPEPPIDATEVPPRLLFSLVRAGFSTRRKMLRRALAQLVTAEQFASAGVDPTVRAEELDLESWGRLCRAVWPEGDLERAASPGASQA